MKGYVTTLEFCFSSDFCLSSRNVEIRFWQRWLDRVKNNQGETTAQDRIVAIA